MRKIGTWLITTVLSVAMTVTPVLATESIAIHSATEEVPVGTVSEPDIPETTLENNNLLVPDSADIQPGEDVSEAETKDDTSEDTGISENEETEEPVGSRYYYKDGTYFDRNDYADGPTREAMYADCDEVGTYELTYEGEYGIELYAERSGFRIMTKESVNEYHTYRIPYLFYGENVTVFRLDENGSTVSADQFTFSKNIETTYGLYVQGRDIPMLRVKYDHLFLYTKDNPALYYVLEKASKEPVTIPYGEYYAKAVTGDIDDPDYTYECEVDFWKGGPNDHEYCHSLTIDSVNTDQICLSYTPSKPFTRVVFNAGTLVEETHTSYDGSVIRMHLYSDAGNYNIIVDEGEDEDHAEEVINETVYSSCNSRDIRFIEFNAGSTGNVYEPESLIAYGNDGNIVLKEGRDYTVEDTVDTVAQKPVRIFKGIGRFKGERVFEKDGFSLTDTCAKVTTKYQSYPYTGKGRKPTPIVTYNGERLVLNKDFTVSYKNNKNVGTATLTITGIGKYSGSASCKFKVRYDLAEAAATTKYASYVYTGNARKPAVTVKYGNTILTNGTDYTLAYKNNKNVGTATIVITGKGKYMNTKEISFKLTPKTVTDASITAQTVHKSYTYNGKAKTPNPVVKDGGRTLVLGTDYTLSYTNNVKVGTGYVIVKGIGNYFGSRKVAFKIVK